ncbi:MAG: serine/threonine-protein kinase [Candidatus Margulisbacteria bacterium]|nr:serine/threonine-protein kinase [Candidatus Margulisiibacteriota bacterium]
MPKFLDEGVFALNGNLWNFAVREYFQGSSLDKIETLQFSAFLWSLYVCLQSLKEYEAGGFLHADIQPSNILINASSRRAFCALIDPAGFKLSPEGRVASYGSVEGAGRPEYVPPEERTLLFPGRTRDVYGLGRTYLELLSGIPAIRSTDQMLRGIQAMCQRASGDDVRSRYQSITEMSEAFDVLRTSESGQLKDFEMRLPNNIL